MTASDKLFFVNEAFTVCELQGDSTIIEHSEENFAKYVAFGGDTLWAVHRDGSVWCYQEETWKQYDYPGAPAGKLTVTASGNAIAISEDGRLFGLEQSGSVTHLAPAGLYTDVSVGTDNILWLVLGSQNNEPQRLMWTTMQNLRPQPLWGGAMGEKVAAAGEGRVGFITHGGEIASCNTQSMAALNSDAGVDFADALSISQHTGTFYVLGKVSKKRKGASVFSWNSKEDKHNAWKELEGITARSIAAG